MRVFDASSIIHAWDHYPEPQFPGLWSWLAESINRGDFVVSKVAYDEVAGKAPDCARWLKDPNHTIQVLNTTNETLKLASSIKRSLGIKNDRYGTGVGENDILIVASAKEHGLVLVTNENRQNSLPQNKSRYKIPAVCEMGSVGVAHANFIEVIKASGVVFR